MILTDTDAVVRAAAADHRAVPGFVAYNLETAQGIVRAAEITGLPVMLLAGSSAFRHAGLLPLAHLALDLARSSEARVGVHLDHSRSLGELETCLDLGYSSVMIDGSHLHYEDNVALTAAAAELAHRAGSWIEGELGGVAGDEDVSIASPSAAMTDPDQAADFVARTGIDALAVAVGNVHGLSPDPPRLDLGRLALLRDAARIPLVLHGASGLSEATLVACLDLGVAKVNVNAELRRSFLDALAAELPAARRADDLAGPLDAGRTAVTTAACTVTRLLGRAG